MRECKRNNQKIKLDLRSTTLLKKRNCRPQACNFIEKEALAQVFSCEFWVIFKKNSLQRTTPVAAFEFLDSCVKV